MLKIPTLITPFLFRNDRDQRINIVGLTVQINLMIAASVRIQNRVTKQRQHGRTGWEELQVES